jgi:outer membrane protein OmpU
MKKILFATTALVATAGVAAADVSVSGRAAFGLQYNGVAKTSVVRNYFDLYFTGTTETDGGVSLSATIEMEGIGAVGGVSTGTKVSPINATTVFSASAGGLTFTYGNTDGAFDKAMTEVHRIPGIGFELWAGASFIDNDDDNNVARIDYAMGDFAVAVSYAGFDKSTGIGVKYSTDLGSAKVTFGAGYESQKATAAPVQAADDYWGLSAKADFGAFSVAAGYADSKNKTQYNGTYNISAQYSANGLTVGANYLNSKNANSNGYTVFGSYGLGGGASLFAQYGERANGTTKTGSMGVAFSF